MRKWLRQRRERRNREIAKAVYAELSASSGWERFLPPVVIRDRMYMVTENGSIYAMIIDSSSGFEQIVQISR